MGHQCLFQPKKPGSDQVLLNSEKFLLAATHVYRSSELCKKSLLTKWSLKEKRKDKKSPQQGKKTEDCRSRQQKKTGLISWPAKPLWLTIQANHTG